MFDQTNTSAVRTKRESASRSMRDTRAIRRADAAGYVSKTATDTSLEKSGKQSGWRDHFAVAVGLLRMSAVVLSGLEALGRLSGNTGMIRSPTAAQGERSRLGWRGSTGPRAPPAGAHRTLCRPRQ